MIHISVLTAIQQKLTSWVERHHYVVQHVITKILQQKLLQISKTSLIVIVKQWFQQQMFIVNSL